MEMEEDCNFSRLETEFSFQFRVPHFGALYLATQADLNEGSLIKVVV
jgi:hypothetical protein